MQVTARDTPLPIENFVRLQLTDDPQLTLIGLLSGKRYLYPRRKWTYFFGQNELIQRLGRSGNVVDKVINRQSCGKIVTYVGVAHPGLCSQLAFPAPHFCANVEPIVCLTRISERVCVRMKSDHKFQGVSHDLICVPPRDPVYKTGEESYSILRKIGSLIAKTSKMISAQMITSVIARNWISLCCAYCRTSNREYSKVPAISNLDPKEG
jgi:hypothetical protein